jgi:predicted N-acetyltransferase YhbS
MAAAFLATSQGTAGRVARLSQLALPLADGVVKLARAVRRPRRRGSLSLHHVDTPGQEFDDLWMALRAEFTCVPVRDRSWIQWRYTADPLNRHDLLVARDRDGVAVGYVAVSETTRRGIVVGRLMDVFASPKRADVVTELVAAALELLEARKVALVSCLGLHPSIRRIVKRFLFVSPKRLELPARLLWSGEPSLENAIYHPDGWHLSYADGDEAFT